MEGLAVAVRDAGGFFDGGVEAFELESESSGRARALRSIAINLGSTGGLAPNRYYVERPIAGSVEDSSLLGG